MPWGNFLKITGVGFGRRGITNQATKIVLIIPWTTSTPSPFISAPPPPLFDFILDRVKGSGDSCPGIDGVPFAFIRAFSPQFAAVIKMIFNYLSTGLPPPEGFNHVIQFFIPKNLSLHPKDTRPISVGNAINRIIARIMADLIAPAAKSILRVSQKGFIPGRQGKDHIEDITEEYYSRLNKKQQIFLLFLDTEKAFDSLDHKFIFQVLGKIGCPGWFINCYKGLLHDVVGTPILSASTKTRIRITRGVKQGCPLSPLIFAFCFDVLLHKLANCNGSPHKDFAFADDLAISSTFFGSILECLKVISLFSRMSGLGINISKSGILTSLPPSDSEVLAIHNSNWSKIKFVTEAQYLGLWMGQLVDTFKVFEGAFITFKDRLSLFRKFIKRSPISSRIMIANIYLLTLFYYLAQFYIIPYDTIVVPVKEMLRKALIPFAGGAFGYCHLVAPKDRGGFASPLRDLWANNYSLLSQNFPFGDSHGLPIPFMGNHECLNQGKVDKNSMLIPDQRAWAAFSTLRDNNPRDKHHNIVTSHLKGAPRTIRSRLYHDLVS
jgi:hypothetical protein